MEDYSRLHYRRVSLRQESAVDNPNSILGSDMGPTVQGTTESLLYFGVDVCFRRKTGDVQRFSGGAKYESRLPKEGFMGHDEIRSSEAADRH